MGPSVFHWVTLFGGTFGFSLGHFVWWDLVRWDLVQWDLVCSVGPSLFGRTLLNGTLFGGTLFGGTSFGGTSFVGTSFSVDLGLRGRAGCSAQEEMGQPKSANVYPVIPPRAGTAQPHQWLHL